MDVFYSFFTGVAFGFASTTVPLFLSCLIIFLWVRYVWAGGGKSSQNYRDIPRFMNYIFTINTSKGLASQGLFWLSILVPFIYFIILGSIAWKDYHLRLDAEGFKTFISISALPLGVLSLALPLSVSVGRFHASAQTAQQIRIVSQKNNIDLYHSHRKEFFSYFEQIGKVGYLGVLEINNKVHPKVHKRFFIGNQTNGIPIPNSFAFQSISKEINSLMLELHDIISNAYPNESSRKYIDSFCPRINAIVDMFGISELPNTFQRTSVRTLPNDEGEVTLTIGDSTIEAIAAFRCIYDFFCNLSDFSGSESAFFEIDKTYHYLLYGNPFIENKSTVIEDIIWNMRGDFSTKRTTHLHREIYST